MNEEIINYWWCVMVRVTFHQNSLDHINIIKD